VESRLDPKKICAHQPFGHGQREADFIEINGCFTAVRKSPSERCAADVEPAHRDKLSNSAGMSCPFRLI